MTRIRTGAYWWLAGGFAIAFLTAVSVISFLTAASVETYSIHSGDMAPTLLKGDLITAQTQYYATHEPQRGDVAVFKLPSDASITYVKRIVGLPGDHIQMRHGFLYINGRLVPRKEDPACRDKAEAGSSVVQRGNRESLPNANGAAVQYCIVKEFGFGGREDGPLDNTPVYDVPAGHYFGMGDNRDNSQDSRILSAVGYIPRANLTGRAETVFWPLKRFGLEIE